MDRQIEVLFVRAVVVDCSADVLGRTGFQSVQYQHATDSRQTDHGATGIVGYAHDGQISATVIEILLHGRPETAAPPDAAELALKTRETAYRNRSIEGASESTANEWNT